MTLTRTAPSVETVTPIKPSEALRLGRLIAPRRIRGAWYDGKGGACALGAIALGLGWRPDADADGSMGANVDCNIFVSLHLPRWLRNYIQDMNDLELRSDGQIVGYLKSQGQ